MKSSASLVHILFVLCICCVSTSLSLAQIRLARLPPAPAAVHPLDAPAPTTLDLDLCVDGSTNYPCPNPVTSDTAYVSDITLTYGQVLDGVVRSDALAGTITLYDNGRLFCTLVLASTTASCPATSTIFDAGVHVIVGQFHDGSAYADSMSLPVTVTVEQDPVSLTIASSQNPSLFGTPLTITATATGVYPAIPTGTVAFFDGNAALPAVALDGKGSASFTTSSLSIGLHQIHASYAGALDFLSAGDVEIDQVISPPLTSTSIVSNLDPSILGENVTFTATVAGAAGTHPSGSVNFKDGTRIFASSLVQAAGSSIGTAQTSISTLSAGTHNVTASYAGDAATGPSASAVLVQQVDYPLTPAAFGYTVTVIPSPVVMQVGATAHLIATVTERGGFSAPVTLACTNLPGEAACTFKEIVIPAGGGSTLLDLSLMAPHDCGSTVPYFTGSKHAALYPQLLKWQIGGVSVLLSGLLLFYPRRRRISAGLFVITGVGLLTCLGGCSSRCTDFGTQPGSYTFKVTGTATPTGAATPTIVETSVGLTAKI